MVTLHLKNLKCMKLNYYNSIEKFFCVFSRIFFQLNVVTQRCYSKINAYLTYSLNFDGRQVRNSIYGLHVPIEPPPVFQLNYNLDFVGNDMGVGQDQPVFTNDETRAIWHRNHLASERMPENSMEDECLLHVMGNETAWKTMILYCLNPRIDLQCTYFVSKNVDLNPRIATYLVSKSSPILLERW